MIHSTTIACIEFYPFRNQDACFPEPINITKRLGLENVGSEPRLKPDENFLLCYAAGNFYWVKANFIKKLK